MVSTRAAFALLALTCVLSAGVQQAAASRDLLASPLLAYPWMPWKDEAGVWQKPADATPDFAKMTLMDLPPVELYLQTAIVSPYTVPQVPLNLIVNNTIAKLNDGKLPTAAGDWVKLAGNAGNIMASSMPAFVQTALEGVLQSINVNGQPLVELPAVKAATQDPASMVKALPQLLNITLAGLEMGQVQEVAEQLHIKLPALDPKVKSSMEELKKIPQLLQVPKDGLTIEDLMKLPQTLEQVAVTATTAADAFAKQLQGVQLPKLEEFFDERSALSLRKFVEKQLNVQLPHTGPVDQVLLNITKTLPSVANQLGWQVQGLDRLPSVLSALDSAFNTAKKEGLVVMDKAGRIDFAATLSMLPDKAPLVQKLVQGIVPAPKDVPQVQQSLAKLTQSLNRLSELSGSVLNPTKRAMMRARQTVEQLNA